MDLGIPRSFNLPLLKQVFIKVDTKLLVEITFQETFFHNFSQQFKLYIREFKRLFINSQVFNSILQPRIMFTEGNYILYALVYYSSGPRGILTRFKREKYRNTQ